MTAEGKQAEPCASSSNRGKPCDATEGGWGRAIQEVTGALTRGGGDAGQGMAHVLAEHAGHAGGRWTMAAMKQIGMDGPLTWRPGLIWIEGGVAGSGRLTFRLGPT